jgi:uncharacterized membrane protein
MKIFLRFLGIIIMVIGLIILAISEFSNQDNNTLLAISGGAIILGLITYVIINRYMTLD